MFKNTYSNIFCHINYIDLSGIVFVVLALAMPFITDEYETLFSFISLAWIFLITKHTPASFEISPILIDAIKALYPINSKLNSERFINKQHLFFYTRYGSIFFFIFCIQYNYHLIALCSVIYMIKLFYNYQNRMDIYKQMVD